MSFFHLSQFNQNNPVPVVKPISNVILGGGQSNWLPQPQTLEADLTAHAPHLLSDQASVLAWYEDLNLMTEGYQSMRGYDPLNFFSNTRNYLYNTVGTNEYNTYKDRVGAGFGEEIAYQYAQTNNDANNRTVYIENGFGGNTNTAWGPGGIRRLELDRKCLAAKAVSDGAGYFWSPKCFIFVQGESDCILQVDTDNRYAVLLDFFTWLRTRPWFSLSAKIIIVTLRTDCWDHATLYADRQARVPSIRATDLLLSQDIPNAIFVDPMLVAGTELYDSPKLHHSMASTIALANHILPFVPH